MRITVHQPDFLPWSGFWMKMMKSERMVIMTGVQFSKGDTTNRVMVKDARLTLPVSRGEGRLIRELTFDLYELKKVIHTIEQKLMCRKLCYGRRLEPVVDLLRQEKDGNLANMNVKLIREIASLLDIHTEIVVDSDLLVGETKTDRLESILDRNTLGGRHTYVSGAGGMNYLEPMEDYDVEYIQGTWPDCSVLQLIAEKSDPVEYIKSLEKTS